MNKPWWRSSSRTWVVILPSGKVKTLGPDPHGARRKNPPRPIADAWHALKDEKETKDRPFRDVAAAYLASLAGCTPGTIRNTTDHIEWFNKYIGKTKVSALRADDVHAYLRTKEWSESTKATAVSKIVAALNHGVDTELIPSHAVRFPRKSRRRKPRFERRRDIVTAEEQDRLIEHANPRLRTFLLGLRESGCRPGELCAARIEDLDLRAGILKVANKTAEQTGETMRDVYLSDRLATLLRDLVGRRTQGLIWLNGDRPFRPDVAGCTLRRLRDRLGMRKGITLYGFRHRWGSNAINNGADSVLVARALGHRDTRMVMSNYYHEDERAMRTAVEKATDR